MTIPTDLYFRVMDVLATAGIYIDMPEEGEGGDPITGSGGFKPHKWEPCRAEAAQEAYQAYKALLDHGTKWFDDFDNGKALNCRVGAACVVHRGDYVLLMQRSARLASGGMWALPGGSVDAESATAAIARELAEEIGLTDTSNLRPLNFWYDEDLDVKDGAPYVCVFFECEAPDDWEPTNVEPHKCDDIEWVKMCDAGFRDLMVGTEAAIMEIWVRVLSNEYGTY